MRRTRRKTPVATRAARMSPATTDQAMTDSVLEGAKEMRDERPEWDKYGGGMDEKVCLITGATSGIGKATAMGLANMGAYPAAMIVEVVLLTMRKVLHSTARFALGHTPRHHRLPTPAAPALIPRAPQSGFCPIPTDALPVWHHCHGQAIMRTRNPVGGSSSRGTRQTPPPLASPACNARGRLRSRELLSTPG